MSEYTKDDYDKAMKCLDSLFSWDMDSDPEVIINLAKAAPDLLWTCKEMINQAHNEGNGEYTIPAWFYNNIKEEIAIAEGK